MNYTKDQLFERFQELPDDVRQSFLSVDTMKILDQVRAKHSLHVDQAGNLSEQVGLLMLGVIRPQDFLSSVQSKLNIPIEVAGEIVKEINQKIFFPIRESLKQIHNPGAPEQYRAESAPKVENFSPRGQVTEASIPKGEPAINTGNNAVIVNAEPKENTNKPVANADKSIFDDKMSKLFRLPKEEVEIGSARSAAPQIPAKPATQSDPYREMPN